MKAVILAGGFGKRLESVNKNIPKPMTRICGKSVLEHQILTLKKEGITEFILVVGYLSEQIKNHFKNGSELGVKIEYFTEKFPLGTAGALFHLGLEDDFLLCNGDLVFDFCLEKMVAFHKQNNALATLLTHPNSHPYDSTLLTVNSQNVVTGMLSSDNKPLAYSNLCNAGVQIISPYLLADFSFEGKANLDKDIILPAIKSGRIYSYKTTEYVKDMGTPERLEAVENDIKNGLVKSKHKSLPQRAIFLDRDGTINVHNGYITDHKQVELIDGVADAIKAFNSRGFIVVVVTNQPVIARGECTLDELQIIHNRIETLLGQQGAFVDGIYFCPHHPDSGFENEIKELKIKCDCRKPSAGMLLKAQKDFNIDMAKSYMVGDSIIDVQAGINGGCRPVLLGKKTDELPTQVLKYESLLEFAESLDI